MASYDEDAEPTAVAVDDRIEAVREYVELDRRFQEEVREIKQRQERAEKARIGRDRARQRLLSLLGVEQVSEEDAEIAAKLHKFHTING